MTHSLDNDPLFLLYDVARLMRLRGDQEARRVGMTRAQWIILLWLDRQPGMTQNALAGFVEVEPITIARLIDRLESRGLVERRLDPKDRRLRRLHLTERAAPFLGQVNAYRTQLNESVTAGLDSETIERLAETLRTLKSNLLIEKRDPVAI